MAARDWEEHASSLYDGAMSDVSEGLDAELRSALVARMSELLGLPLDERVQVSAQRMQPGEDVRVHTDQPLLGYETARLVVQLNHDWRPEQGGALSLHTDDLGPPRGAPLLPRYNSAIAFALTDTSFHSVSRTERARRSVVFYFWHRANGAALRAALHQLFEGMRFASLPESAQDELERVDAELPEGAGRRAALVAWALQRWGANEAASCAALEHVARLSAPLTVGDEDDVLLRFGADAALACWAADVFEHHFDAVRWQRLAASALEPESAGARALWRDAFVVPAREAKGSD